MPQFSTAEKIHIGTMTSKFPDTNRSDVILELTITSNGNGVSHALVAFYITNSNQFKYDILYSFGLILDNIIKYKVVGKSVDFYCNRSGIKLLVKPFSVGSNTLFTLDMSTISSLPEDVQDVIIE